MFESGSVQYFVRVEGISDILLLLAFNLVDLSHTYFIDLGKDLNTGTLKANALKNTVSGQ